MLIKQIIAISLFIFISNNNIYAEDIEVKNYVHKLITGSLNILNDDNMDKKKKTIKVKEILSENLDSVWMGRFVLGRTIKTISADNLSNFLKAYGKYLVTTYANSVSGYKGEKVEVRSLETLKDGLFIVKTQVLKNAGNPINVEYLVHKVDNSYKVCDITTEGISLVNTQRSEYGGIIENDGVEALISQLEEKTPK